MNKKALIALFLLLIPTASAISPFILGALFGAGIIGGGIAGFFLGSWLASDNSGERIAELEAQLTASKTINDALIKDSLAEQEAYTTALLYETQDFVTYSKNYVWALVKYKVWEAKNNNLTVSECWDLVNESIKNFYKNQTLNIVTLHNSLSKSVASKINLWVELGTYEILEDQGNIAVIDVMELPSFPEEDLSFVGVYYLGVSCCGDSRDFGWKLSSNEDIQWSYQQLSHLDYTITVAGEEYTLYVIDWGITSEPIAYVSFYTNESIAEPVYNFELFYDALREIDSTYHQMISNAEQYVIDVYVYDVSTDEVIDPYVLATFLAQDINETGYYAYYAAEMALLGLPTNITSAFLIEIDGTNYTGFLFTDAFTTINVNETYTLPSKAYFIDENGTLYVLDSGTTFKVIHLFNPMSGEELNSTTLIRYVDHSGDVTKIVEELNKLYDLYEQYLQMQTVSGGGGSFFDWFNNLSDKEKIALIGIGVIVLVLIARR